MQGNEYQEQAMRTNDGKCSERLYKEFCKHLRPGLEPTDIDFGALLMGCLGISGEAGEFCDIVKKVIFHKSKFDENHLQKELGDILWYVACICEAMHWSLDDIMQTNIDKLQARYPEGFDVVKANNRKEGDI